MPRSPSSGAVVQLSDMAVTAPKFCCSAVMPDSVMLSCHSGPDVFDPSPYEIRRVVVPTRKLVDDFVGSYFLWGWHGATVQAAFGTQASADPVSKLIKKG